MKTITVTDEQLEIITQALVCRNLSLRGSVANLSQKAKRPIEERSEESRGRSLHLHRRHRHPPVVTQRIPYTDFPFEEFPEGFKCYVQLADENLWVCMLPSEY